VSRAPRVAVAAILLVLAAPAAVGEETPPPTPEQIAAQERIRPIVNAIWQDVRAPKPGSENSRPRLFWDVTDRLVAIGPEVVPFLTAELDLTDPQTAHFSAYALGRLGGPEADAALRKAIRISDARGGRFAVGLKRFSVFALALTGNTDALDLMQRGNAKLHGAVMVPEFPLAAHVAILLGPPAAPVFERQVETYRADPDAGEQLEDALLGWARVGERASAPKLVPLLGHASPRVRALAADAIARTGDPALCTNLMPLLGDKDQGEKLAVAAALERWKPMPCYKAIVGRLEVEEDVGTRASLYSAIVSMGGEPALDVFRAFLRSPNQFDQAVVVDSIGRIGSKKGLNLLRSLLPDANANTVAHALAAMAAIGGEGAMDTLFAATNDRRPFVASSAAETLTALGDKRVAPRRASELLALVKDPIGNLTLRARVVELTEALVTLRYTEPIDDLKTAAKVQTDLEIVEALNSCVRRLVILKEDGDNDVAWAAELASPEAPVRALAETRLAELSTAAAIKALTAQLARTDVADEERAHIFEAFGRAKTSAAAPLIERNLSDPAFDAWELREARTSAAYAARRLAGPKMIAALRASALRRDGRDWASVLYWAILDGPGALDSLRTLRVRRLRYPEAGFGKQEETLGRIIDDIAAGRTLAPYDVGPDDLHDD
jgi:HEAT repeat protein